MPAHTGEPHQRSSSSSDSCPADTLLNRKCWVSQTYQRNRSLCQHHTPGLSPEVTFIAVEGIGGQAQGCGTDIAAETFSVEEVTLSTQPLHHVYTLLAEETGIAATQVSGK